MKKNLRDDIISKSLNELTELANEIIRKLENEKDLENSVNEYQKLLKLNNLIEKKFHITNKEISEDTKSKIRNIVSKKNEKKKLNNIAKDTNLFLKKYLKSQKKTELLKAMKYGLLPGGKKNKIKILVDVGKIFNINYNVLIQIGAAVECIHAYTYS